MRIKIIAISILFLIFAIIAAQNTITTQLKFLLWSLEAPLIVMIVVIFILGLVIGLVFSSNYERRKKKEEVDFQKKKEEKTDQSGSSKLS